jgi:hypothetical protein
VSEVPAVPGLGGFGRRERGAWGLF